MLRLGEVLFKPESRFFPILSVSSTFLKTSGISNPKFPQKREGIWRKNEFTHVVCFVISYILHYEQFQKL